MSEWIGKDAAFYFVLPHGTLEQDHGKDKRNEKAMSHPKNTKGFGES